MATPKQVRTNIGYMTLDLDGLNREDACREVNRQFDEAETRGFTDVRLDWQQEDYGERYQYVLRGDRMETMDEAIAREAKEAKQRQWSEERDRQEFERLSKKFK